jgi:ankyrin repeat protein
MLAAPDIDINAANNKRGQTPLWWAAYRDHEAVVSQLLAPPPGIDVNAADDKGQAPLLVAQDRGCKGIAKLLEKSLTSLL